MAKHNSIVLNFLYQSGYQILNIIIPFITTPYIARVLGATNVGIHTYTYSIAVYFTVVAMLGIETYGCRSFAKVDINDFCLRNKIFSDIYYLHLLISGLVLLVYFVFVVITPQYKLFYFIHSLHIVASLLDINWFFWGIEKFESTTIRSALVRIVSLILIFVFVKDENDLVLYSVIMAICQFMNALSLWPILFKYVSFCKASIRSMMKHLKPLFMLFGATVATTLYLMTSKTILGLFGDMEELGCFEYADRIIRLPVTLITALGTVMLPRMTALLENKKDRAVQKYLLTTSEFVFIMSVALSFGMYAVSEEFVNLFLGAGFQATSVYIRVMSISIIFMGFNNMIRTQVLMPKSQDRIYTIAVWVGAAANVILNIAFVSHIGAMAAALATVVSYFIVCLFQIYPIRKEIPIKRIIAGALVPLASGIIMVLVIDLLGNYLYESWASLMIKVIIGGFVYLALCLVGMKLTNSSLLTQICSVAGGRKK